MAALPLTAEEDQRLRIFQARVEDLRNSTLAGGKRDFSTDLLSDSSLPTGVNDEEFRSFLTTLRQFTLNDDQAHFFSIHNLVQMKCQCQRIKDWVAYSRKLWKRAMSVSPLGIELDGEMPTVEDLLCLFLYGGIVHSDPQLTEKINSLPPSVVSFLKMALLAGLRQLCHALVLMDKAIWHWLDAPNDPVPELPVDGS